MTAWAAIWSFGWFAGPRGADVGRTRQDVSRGASSERPRSGPSVSSPNPETATIDARDAAWMGLIAHGDVAAFRALFDAYVVPLVRLARGYVRSDDVAQDVVQDVFVAVWERRESLTINGRVSAYLTVATRNRALNAVRAATRAARREDEAARDAMYPVSAHFGDAAVEAEEFRVALRAAVAAMPERQREVFLLHREQGLDYPTIAAALGVTVPSVHNTMSRALARLRDALRDLL